MRAAGPLSLEAGGRGTTGVRVFVFVVRGVGVVAVVVEFCFFLAVFIFHFKQCICSVWITLSKHSTKLLQARGLWRSD
jgi:hypothetical protein